MIQSQQRPVSAAQIPVNRQTVRKRRRGRRRLPPGQRLVCDAILACLLIFCQAGILPAGTEDETGPAYVREYQPAPFTLKERMESLDKAIAAESTKPRLRAGVFLVEPTTGRYAERDARASFPAASMIKIPVYVAYLQALDNKDISADQELTIRPELVAGGSGFLQWRTPGSKVRAAEAAELMMTHSDNTATNLIIELVGGMEAVNRRAGQWGLSQTRINNWLPDFAGTNRTSPYDLVLLLARVDQGEILSSTARTAMLGTMARCRTRTLLPQGLGPGAKIYHKTGDIGSMVGDAGIVAAPDGHRYLLAVQVERPHNDRRANQLVRDISGMVYHEFTGWTPPPKPKTAPKKQRSRKHRRHR